MLALDTMASLTPTQQIVQAEKIHVSRRLSVLSQFLPEAGSFTTHEIAGSLTSTTSAIFGRKLNLTIGLGVFGPWDSNDLAAIEETYVTTGLPPELDMFAPAVTDPILELLTASGYEQTGTIETFELDLTPPSWPLPGPPSDIVVEETKDEAAFVAASIAGFRSGGRSPELLGLLARAAARREDTRTFLARRGGVAVGSAAMAMVDVERGGKEEVVGLTRFANFYTDSTISEFRGHGVHAELLRSRLRLARGLGAQRAIASARAGSGSARNIQRAGFAKAFETWTFTKSGGSKGV